MLDDDDDTAESSVLNDAMKKKKKKKNKKKKKKWSVYSGRIIIYPRASVVSNRREQMSEKKL